MVAEDSAVADDGGATDDSVAAELALDSAEDGGGP